MADHVLMLDSIMAELRQKCKNKGEDCEICARMAETIEAAKAALSHAAGQEAVAWFVQLDAPGYRDHGTKLGPFSKESEADCWTHRREDGIEWKKVPLYLAQPSTSAEVGRDD